MQTNHTLHTNKQSACGSFFHFIAEQTQKQKSNANDSFHQSNYKQMMPDIITRYNEAIEIFGDGLIPYVVDKQMLGDVDIPK
jgi:hypothetical protein